MIIELEEKYISDVAEAQMLAWQRSFQGILSEENLRSLKVEDFENTWKQIIQLTQRRNFIWLNKNEKAVGFVSFGKPKDTLETAEFEIYGIYVHPDFWCKKIGFKLMKSAVETMKKYNPTSRIVLWVMQQNLPARKFYERFGFFRSNGSRISTRNGEKFAEIQYELRETPAFGK